MNTTCRIMTLSKVGICAVIMPSSSFDRILEEFLILKEILLAVHISVRMIILEKCMFYTSSMVSRGLRGCGVTAPRTCGVLRAGSGSAHGEGGGLPVQ